MRMNQSVATPTGTKEPPIWGLMAEFRSPDELLKAAEHSYEEGYRRMDAYSPFPIEELAEAIGYRRRILPWIVLAGGVVGCLAGFSLQYWGVGDRAPDERRRTSAQQLAGFHPGYL